MLAIIALCAFVGERVSIDRKSCADVMATLLPAVALVAAADVAIVAQIVSD